jgi:hypothetical protein
MQRTIEENKRRLALINAPYDPFTGEGSPLPRTLVEIPDSPLSRMWLPNDMLKEKAVQELIQHGFRGVMAMAGYTYNDKNLNLFWESFSDLRNKYDFEWYARLCNTISDKGKGRDIPFTLNYPQRKYLKQLEELRTSGLPIDIILLKARQWGGSTLTQLYMLWIQLVHKKNWNSVICGDIEKQSSIVAGMLAKVIRNFPLWASGGCRLSTSPYQGAQKTRVISHSNSRYSLGSAQKPDSLRSEDISMAHLTEVGLWKATAGKKPEDLVQSIFGSIASGPYTMKVIESTAKGVGNYFHRTWQDAVKGINNFHPVFIAWFDIPLYSKPIEDYEAFIPTMTEREKELFELGATLEAIAWYRDKSTEFPEEWRLASEYPSTPTEAFQSTGRRVFTLGYVKTTRESCVKAWWRGDVDGNLLDCRFIQGNGNMEIWYKPDLDTPMRDRYVVSVDVGGVGDKSDYSCIRVFDRYSMIECGIPEVVAQWYGHIEHDKLAWKAAQIAHLYGDALLVIEANTLETAGTEGNHFEYILNEIADHYPNLYSRTSEIEIKQGRPRRWGFHTNTSTKPLVIDHLNKALRDGLYIEHCSSTCDELDLYEYKENGKEMGAVEGNHDDRVMATAIGLWVCYNYPLPVVVNKHNPSTKKTRIISEASI